MSIIKEWKKKLHFTSVSKVDRLFFVQNLQVMVRSGFPMADALQTMSLQTKNKEFKEAILDIHEQVQSGVPFHESLKRHNLIFDELFINLIEAGEVSGNLEESLKQLLVQMKKSYALSKKIRNALMYPCIILVAMVIIGIGMIIFVLPNLIKLYSESDFKLPLPTRITIAASQFMIDNFLVIGIVAFVLVAIIIFILSKEKGKYYWHKIQLKLPILGPIVKKINLAKLCRVLNSLIITDIPITEDFQIIGKTLGNRIYRNYLNTTAKNLKGGESIYKIFSQRPDLFPPVVSQMINIGEKSGTLDNISKELAEFYEEEVSDVMANLTVIIEPIVMLAAGIGVAFVAVSVIYPIYALVDQI
jgi:type IV pilus assembly protein PilC